MLRKMAGRLVGLVTFLCSFACLGVVIILLSTGVVDLREMFPGLPEPPPIDTGRFPLPDEAELITPDVDLPDLAPGETRPLRERVERRPLLARIPAPQQLSTDPRVVGTNLFLAILMALIFGATSTVLGNMLRDEEDRINAWLEAIGILKLFPKVLGWASRRPVKQGCLTLPLFVLIFALYGIIFAFLEAGTTILSRDGAFLAITMAFTVGLVSMGGDIAQRVVARFWRTGSKFTIYPTNLLLAIFTVGVSRVLHLSPGIVFGTPGGSDVDLGRDEQGTREVILAFATLVILVVLGGIGWALSGAVLYALDAPFDERIIDIAAAVMTGVQNTSLALFLVALETTFFETLPLAYGLGRTVFKWSKIAWVIIFTPIVFLFNHALLNPRSGFLDSFQESNVRFMWFVLFLLVGLTGGLWFYFNVVDDVLQEWLGIRKRPPSQGPPPPAPPGAPGGYYPQQGGYPDPHQPPGGYPDPNADYWRDQ